MACLTDSCTQGREPCPTPWRCGYDIPTPDDALSWTEWALLFVITASVTIMVAWGVWTNWPLIVALLK